MRNIKVMKIKFIQCIFKISYIQVHYENLDTKAIEI